MKIIFKSTILLALVVMASLPAHGQQVVNSLVYLNAQRAQFGLPPLQLDPELQAAAEKAAQTRASGGIHTHLEKKRVRKRWGWKWEATPVAGFAEGVAVHDSRKVGPAGRRWDYRDVFACYQATGSGVAGNFDFKYYQFAGCASAIGPDGYWYYQLNLR